MEFSGILLVQCDATYGFTLYLPNSRMSTQAGRPLRKWSRHCPPDHCSHWRQEKPPIPHQVPLGQVSTKADARGGTLAPHETTALEGADNLTGVSSRSPAMSRGRKTHETQDNITPHGNHTNPQRKRERVLQMVHEATGGSQSPKSPHAPLLRSRAAEHAACTQCGCEADTEATQTSSAQRGSLHRTFTSPSWLLTKTLSAEKQKTEGQRGHNQDSAIPPEQST